MLIPVQHDSYLSMNKMNYTIWSTLFSLDEKQGGGNLSSFSLITFTVCCFIDLFCF